MQNALNITKAAELLGITYRQVIKLCRRKLLQHIRYRDDDWKTWVTTPEWIRDYMNQHSVKAIRRPSPEETKKKKQQPTISFRELAKQTIRERKQLGTTNEQQHHG